MTQIPRWRRYIRFWGPDVNADIEDELSFHLSQRELDLRSRGVGEEEARRKALEEFGDVEATRRGLHAIDERMEHRRERASWWLAAMADVRYALRGLRSTPLFTAGVVLTLALGIGAATTMYGITNHLLIQPPPHVVDPEGVFRVFFEYSLDGDSVREMNLSSYPLFDRFRDQARSLAGLAVYASDQVVIGSGADAQPVSATLVSEGFWRTLGTRPTLGRFMSDEECNPATGARVAVLSHSLWQRRFGGNPAVLDSTLLIKGRHYQVIGVAPSGFRGVELEDTDVWLPLFAKADGDRGYRGWYEFAGSGVVAFVARPRKAVARSAAAAELARITHALQEEESQRVPPESRHSIKSNVVLENITGAIGDNGQRIPAATVTLWLTAVALVLFVIACANVSSLLLIRALKRSREIAVRRALGMSRSRLIAMLFTESGVLAVAGGVAALALSWAAHSWTSSIILPEMLGEARAFDWHVFAMAAGAIVLAALITGMAPVLQTRRDSLQALKHGGQHGTTTRLGLYRGLLMAQTALSALLLVGSGLFVMSLHKVTSVDLGLETENSYDVHIDFTGSGRSAQELGAFFERALLRVRSVPGVRSASLALNAPLRGARGIGLRAEPGGDWVEAGRGFPLGNYVSDGFFEATGMQIVRGRAILPSDRPRTGADGTRSQQSPSVVVLNENLAALGWPERSAVGECAYLSGAQDVCARVVGVVRNAHAFRVTEDQMLQIYAPLRYAGSDTRELLIGVDPGMQHPANVIARVLREMDPDLPYVDVQRLGDALNPEIRPWRLGAEMFTLFGGIAALLAALGLYTSVAFAVTQRTREIGIRIAVGAASPRVVRLVLGEGLRVALAGIVIGLALALVAGRWIADLLFQTSPHEPSVLAAVALTLLLISFFATVVPARRAARVSPMEALRAE